MAPSTVLMLLWTSISLAAAGDPATVTGGDEAAQCAFPSAAEVSSGAAACSGVLVHPKVVVLDRTCYDFEPANDVIYIGFGDGSSSPVSAVVPKTACGFDGAMGVCLLSDELDLPIAPIAYGCEDAAFTVGTPALLVGYGAAAAGVYDELKIVAEVELSDVTPGTLWIEGEGAPCSGDSGAPLFVRQADGSLRVVGVAAASSCDNPTAFVRLSAMVPFIEEATGLDVTPCHDALGLPDVTSECGSFYAGGLGPRDEGMWSNQCAEAPVGPAEGGCEGDDAAPSVTIAQPTSATEYPDAPASVRVEVVADDGDGVGIRDVRLVVDGAVQPIERAEAPFEFDVDLPEGTWALSAVARDWAGNQAMADEVMLYVGEVPAPGSDDSGGGTSSSGGDPAPADVGSSGEQASSSGGDAALDEGNAARGCACAVPSGAPRWGASVPWAVVIATWRIRRREVSR